MSRHNRLLKCFLVQEGDELLAYVQFFKDKYTHFLKKCIGAFLIRPFPSQPLADGVRFEKEVFHFKCFVIQALAPVLVWKDIN